MKFCHFLLLVIFINFSNSFKIKNFQRNAVKTVQVSQDDKSNFLKWKQKHGKIYKTQAEEDHALESFTGNSKDIEAHNNDFKSGKVTYTRALWMRSDLSYEEKLHALMGEIPTNDTERLKRQLKNQFPTGPAEVNWVKAGRVNSIRDQGVCGSCWA